MLGLLTISASTARFIVQDKVTNNVPLCTYLIPSPAVKPNSSTADILAMTEYTISIIILSSISLRPLLRQIYSVATDSHDRTPYSRSTKAQHSTTEHRRRTRADIYGEDVPLPGYGSEVELTEVAMGRIYKTEEISVKSEHETIEEGKNQRRSFGTSMQSMQSMQ
jgi:hypothetical protein